MLDLKNVSKTFYPGTVNEKRALVNFSLHLDPGEFVTIIGSNGAGKSTLFNAIAGVWITDEGKIIIDGEDVTFQSESTRAKVIGRIFQDPMKGTSPSLTIEENLAIAYSIGSKNIFRSAISKKDEAFFRETLARLDMGLEDRMKVKIGTLSGGQRQAVTLLMATLVTPKILLLDEHTAALDPLTAEKVLEITKEIVETRKITTLMITHNIASALDLGTRTLMMDNGQIAVDIKGEERAKLDVDGLLKLYRETNGKALDNDRILLS